MDLFEFILIMTSVIFALAVAQILSGVSRLAQAPGKVQTFPAHTLWVVQLFVSIFLGFSCSLWWPCSTARFWAQSRFFTPCGSPIRHGWRLQSGGSVLRIGQATS